MATKTTPRIRCTAEVPMDTVALEELALRHQDALEAEPTSPKTRRFYAWGQRQRYRLIAERERTGQWRRATV